MRDLRGITIAILLIAMHTTNVFSYDFTADFDRGFYWANFPISMTKFAVDDSEGSQLASFTDQAEEEWESSTGTEIWSMPAGYTVTNSFSGNYIRWSSNFAAETGYDPFNTLAITIRYSSGTHIVRTEIIINGNLDILRNNSNNALYKTILHELGHTVGLDHSTEFAIMAPTISGTSSLQADDVNGMNALIDETLRRQSTGFVSEFASVRENDSDAFGTCGTIDLDGESRGGGGGSLSFIISIFLGILLTSVKEFRFKSI